MVWQSLTFLPLMTILLAYDCGCLFHHPVMLPQIVRIIAGINNAFDEGFEDERIERHLNCAISQVARQSK